MKEAYVEIIIPLYNKVKMTRDCVTSVLNVTEGVTFNITLVNNGSTEDLKELDEVLKDDRVSMIDCPEKGFTTAVNAGLKEISTKKSPLILLLNNDTIIQHKNWLVSMAKKCTDKVGAVGPVSNMVTGKQHQRFCDGRRDEYANMLIGFCLLVRRDAFMKVGYFLDNDYNNIASDDLDLSIRLRKGGYRLMIDRESFVYHIGEATQKEMIKGDSQSFYKQGNDIVVKKHGQEEYEKCLQTNPRMLLGIPTGGLVSHESFGSFMSLERPSNTSIMVSHRGVVHLSRNLIIKEAIKMGAEYLMFIDDDMVFSHDLITRLLKCGADVVTGLAFKRGATYFPCAFIEKDGKYKHIKPRQGLVNIDACGMACCLIKLKVLEAIKDPWCEWTEFGEDITFCRKIRKAGFNILCDSDLIVGHLGDKIVVTDETYMNHRRKEQIKKMEEEENETNTATK